MLTNTTPSPPPLGQDAGQWSTSYQGAEQWPFCNTQPFFGNTVLLTSTGLHECDIILDHNGLCIISLEPLPDDNQSCNQPTWVLHHPTRTPEEALRWLLANWPLPTFWATMDKVC